MTEILDSKSFSSVWDLLRSLWVRWTFWCQLLDGTEKTATAGSFERKCVISCLCCSQYFNMVWNILQFGSCPNHFPFYFINCVHGLFLIARQISCSAILCFCHVSPHSVWVDSALLLTILDKSFSPNILESIQNLSCLYHNASKNQIPPPLLHRRNQIALHFLSQHGFTAKHSCCQLSVHL